MKSNVLMAILLIVFSNSANSVVVTVDQINTTGSRWVSNYSISNTTLSNAIEQFTVYFDYSQYENLAIVSTPVDWDSLIVQPDTLLPDDGFYDVLALNNGIALGQTLSGFSVSFDWLGSNAPNAQNFDIVDPNTFNVLSSGQAVVTAVPEPNILILMILGLFTLVLTKLSKTK